MRKLSERERIRRGCTYCADSKVMGSLRNRVGCTLDSCPYYELEKKSFSGYEKDERNSYDPSVKK